MKPVVFFEEPFSFKENFSFELMNLGLNMEDEMLHDFAANAPHFDDVVKYISSPVDIAKNILIFGKAKINITNLKGLCIQMPNTGLPPYEKVTSWFGRESKFIPARGLYFEHPYTLEKGDRLFVCGGHSSFSDNYVNVYMIAGGNTKATITFSSEEYAIKESEDKDYEIGV